MKFIKEPVLLLILVSGVYVLEAQKGKQEPKPRNVDLTKNLSETQLKFAIDLYKSLPKTGNLVISPYSVGLSLAMYMAGSEEITTEKFVKTLLGLNNFTTNEQIHKAFSSIVKSMVKPNETNWKLTSANRLYVSPDNRPSKAKAATIRKCYNARVLALKVDKKNANKVAKKINSWVKMQTEGKIERVVSASDLDQRLQALVVNALYFKGAWVKPFDATSTKPKKFYVSSNQLKTASMMNSQDVYQISSCPDLNGQMLAMDYVGDRMTMYVILPNDVDGLSEVEEQLTPDVFNTLKASLKPEEIDVYLPKLQCSFGGSFNTFSDQNVGKLFDRVTLAQQVYINVDEFGSEAAAATELKLNFLSRVKEFNVNHPFIFILYDRLNQAILFMGRVTDPGPLHKDRPFDLDVDDHQLEADLTKLFTSLIGKSKPKI